MTMDFQVFSLLFGALGGLLAWFVLRLTNPEDALYAIPFGLGMTLVLSVILHILLHLEEKRYRQAEVRFSETPVFICEGAVHFGAEIRGARFYLFRESVLILCLDKKPMLKYSVPLSGIREIRRESAKNGAILHLFTFEADGEIRFFSRSGGQAADMLIPAVKQAKAADSVQGDTNHDG